MSKARSTGNLNNAIQVSDTGAITFVSGSTTLATINTTGQLSGSTSVKSATTASYADSFTVAGTLTAQTLVVQTITSSVEVVTGSTQFGTLNSNTHTYTGSLAISGSSTFGLNVNNGALYVSSSGLVGIGTTSPGGKLDVAAGTGANILITADATNLVAINNYSAASGFQDLKFVGANHHFYAGTAGGGSASEKVTITTAGYIGIGTNSPSYILDVSGSGMRLKNSGGSADILLDRASTSAGATFQYLTNGTLKWYTGLRGLTNNSFYIFNNATSTNALILDETTSAATFSSSVTVGGYLTGQGINPGGLGGSRYVLDWLSGRMRIFSYGADASTNGGFLFNSQRSDGTNSVDFLTIASTGAATFSSSVTAGGTIYATGGNSSDVNNVAIRVDNTKFQSFYNAAATGWAFSLGADASNNGNLLANNNLIFGTGASATERMRITSGGNVGIGTTNPSQKLEVSGTDNNNYIMSTSTTGAGGTVRIQANEAGSYLTSNNARPLYLQTNSATAMTITSAGNVGIGTSFGIVGYFVGSQTGGVLQVATNVAKTATSNSYPVGFFGSNDSSYPLGLYIGILTGATTGTRQVKLQGTEIGITPNTIVMQQDGANVLIGTTTDNGPKLAVTFASSGTATISAANTSAANSRCYYGQKYSGSTDDYYMIFDNVVANKFLFYGNGGLGNVQANNANISDIKTKKDITPLESYWDKFKAIEIVKFKYKDQTHDDFNIGVIAQQVEEVAPEFVNDDEWGVNTPTFTETLKSVYTTDLYHAAIKVLQEAMAKIEALEAENDTLKEILTRNNIQ